VGPRVSLDRCRIVSKIPFPTVIQMEETQSRLFQHDTLRAQSMHRVHSCPYILIFMKLKVINVFTLAHHWTLG